VCVNSHYDLWVHPAEPNRAIDAVSVGIERPIADRLLLTYRVAGRIEDIVIPPARHPLRRDRLWESTCFELFLQSADTSAYFEFNFSPSGEWAAYGLEAYRAGMAQAAVPAAPAMTLSSGPGEMIVEVALSLWPTPEPWRLGIGVIIEEKIGSKSYWAITHKASVPDFHRADCFVGEVPPPAAS
jgi:hypothetical protein